MKKLSIVAGLLLLALVSSSAWAALKTVTLSVSQMYCAACPITVKKALMKVDGVTKTDVSYEKKEAVVTYDDAKTSVEALVRASTNAGYPAELKK